MCLGGGGVAVVEEAEVRRRLGGEGVGRSQRTACVSAIRSCDCGQRDQRWVLSIFKMLKTQIFKKFVLSILEMLKTQFFKCALAVTAASKQILMHI